MAKVEDSLPPTPAPRMMATSGDTDDMAKGTNLCKGSLLFFFLKKKTSIDEHLWCAKYYAKPWGFVCLCLYWRRKRNSLQEEGMEAVADGGHRGRTSFPEEAPGEVGSQGESH